MINLEGAMALLKAATYLMKAGQQGVRLYKQCKDPKDPEREPRRSIQMLNLGGWPVRHYVHCMPEPT